MKPLAFHHNPYRRWCWSWWKHWVDVRQICREVKWVWQRARYGYAECDLFSLDAYLASWLPSALRELNETLNTVTVQSPRQHREMLYAIEAWEGLRHLSWECECWNDETKYDDVMFWEKHDEYWRKRWEFGERYFMKNIRRYWW